jgi:chemotaxis protein CheD
MTLVFAENVPKPLPGFEHINHYWDRLNKMPAAKILPGEYYVTKADEIITTVLGSCISVCIHDLSVGVGGMNHFMLPISKSGGWKGAENPLSEANRYGNYAMEHMINELLKHGATRENLEVKIFGGGQIISKLTQIGEKNIEFIHLYIRNERLRLASEDVGGVLARKVVYYPATGRVRVKKLKQLHNNTIVERESRYIADIERRPVKGEIELF